VIDQTYPILDPAVHRHMARHSCAFALMAKAPRAGMVKTRLQPLLTSEDAAALSRSFIRDMAGNLAGLLRDRRNVGVVAFAPAGEESAFAGLLPTRFWLLPQRGVDLGERLLHAAEDLFLAGFDLVCLLNSDSPTLPRSLLADAARSLREPGDRVVFGAAEDGGYYLIGLKKPHKHLFHAIDWSTERVLAQSIERAGQIGLEVARLPAWYDVDDAGSLQLLYREVVGSPEAAGMRCMPGYRAPHTARLLRKLAATNRDLRSLFAEEPAEVAAH
jgi:rSAM/selenodomain-associated transferase 1